MTIELTLTALSLRYITSGFGLGVRTMQKAGVRVMGGKRKGVASSIRFCQRGRLVDP